MTLCCVTFQWCQYCFYSSEEIWTLHYNFTISVMWVSDCRRDGPEFAVERHRWTEWIFDEAIVRIWLGFSKCNDIGENKLRSYWSSFSILSILAYAQQHEPKTLYTVDCKWSRLWDTLHNCCVSFSYHLTLHWGSICKVAIVNYKCQNQESYKGNVTFTPFCCHT